MERGREKSLDVAHLKDRYELSIEITNIIMENVIRFVKGEAPKQIKNAKWPAPTKSHETFV